jgi:tRNA threonylcarbamoyladenosine biosynthesis protein TsaB
MPLILHIETATIVCSVALSKDGQLLALKESETKNSHSSELTLFIDEVVKSPGFVLADLDAIAISEGPGSYTGLRIGVATAKGLCYALDKPLIGIPTLKAMAAGMPHTPSPSLYCPMIDARRMEVFSAIFDDKGNEIRDTRAEIIDENSFHEYLAKNKMVFAGDGAEKCKQYLENHPNAVFLSGFKPSAKFMIAFAEEKYSNQLFENLAYFEPFYLKDFVAGKPRVKGLD